MNGCAYVTWHRKICLSAAIKLASLTREDYGRRHKFSDKWNLWDIIFHGLHHTPSNSLKDFAVMNNLQGIIMKLHFQVLNCRKKLLLRQARVQIMSSFEELLKYVKYGSNNNQHEYLMLMKLIAFFRRRGGCSNWYFAHCFHCDRLINRYVNYKLYLERIFNATRG